MWQFFEIFVRSLGEGAPEPKVRLTVACPLDGPFSLGNSKSSVLKQFLDDAALKSHVAGE